MLIFNKKGVFIFDTCTSGFPPSHCELDQKMPRSKTKLTGKAIPVLIKIKNKHEVSKDEIVEIYQENIEGHCC